MKKNVLLSLLILFFVQKTVAQSSGIYESYCILSLNGGANTYYDLQATTANPDFNGANLGMFRQGSTQLVLNGAQNKTYKNGGCDITNGELQYRVYLTSGSPGSFSPLNLPYSCEYPTAGCGSNAGDQVWEVTNGAVNILNTLTPGNYTLEVYTSANYQGCGTGTHYANNGGANYKATFTVYSDFITTWKTDNAGSTGSTSIRIPTTGTGYNYDVDWNNDGVYDQFGITGDVTHNFGVAGTYTIRIRGAFPRIFMKYYDSPKLLEVSQWGSITLTSMAGAFQNCSNLNITAADLPDMAAVTDMSDMFRDCHSLNGPANIGSWNTAAVTNMTGLFAFATAFNQPVGAWTTSSVTNMSYMFAYATSFNQPVGGWNTAAVTQMEELFNGASSFNQSVANWSTSNVNNMFGMFYNAVAFNQSLGNWTLKSNVFMTLMLDNCGMDCSAYSATLIGWRNNPSTPSGRSLGAAGKQHNYTGATARNYLVYSKSWTINDAGIGATSYLGGTAGGTQVCLDADVSVGKLYTDGNCNSLLMIKPNGASPINGTVNACVKVDNTVQLYNGEAYLQRHFDITPAANPTTATARITLYVLHSEFLAFNAANAAHYPDLPANFTDAAGIAALRVTQYGGTGTAPGNYTGPTKLINPDDADIVWNGYHWEISFNTTGFSGFYIHAPRLEFPLPVTLLSFSGYKDGSRNQLSWTTGTEINNRGFDVQRSVDGINYASIGFVNSLATGGNSNNILSYRFTDNTAAGAKQYYRLRQEDLDGRSKLSNIVLINGARPTVMVLRSIFPNPADATASILVDAPADAKLTVQLIDMTGRYLVQKLVNVAEGSNTVALNIISLQSGTYLVRVISENGEVVTGKLMKQ